MDFFATESALPIAKNWIAGKTILVSMALAKFGLLMKNHV
jgi:hypothetical protein